MLTPEVNIIIIYLFLAFACACVIDFFDFCIGEPSDGNVSEGRIFTKYGKWLMKLQKQGWAIYKPLGGCMMCCGVWISWIVLASSFLIGLVGTVTDYPAWEVAGLVILFPTISLAILNKI